MLFVVQFKNATVTVTEVEENMQICKKASHLHRCPTEHMMVF